MTIIMCFTEGCDRPAIVKAQMLTVKSTRAGNIFGKVLRAYCLPCSRMVADDALTPFEYLTPQGGTRTLTVAQWIAERRSDVVPT